MESIRIIENFLTPPASVDGRPGPHPLAIVEGVRQSAIVAGFGTWAPACDSVLKVNAFKGVGYMGNHGAMLYALARAIGQPAFPHEMKFRVTGTDADPSYIHSDRSSGHFTCVAYLSDDPDPESGTAFYRYRPSGWFPFGLDRMPCYQQQQGTHAGDALKADMLTSEEAQWEPTVFVRARINTAVIFRADLFHRRMPILCTGDTPATARMVWVCHYTVPGSSLLDPP